MKSGVSTFKPLKIQFIESAPEIAIRSRNRNGFCQAPHALTTKSIKLIHAAHAKAAQA
jgi:hypothetical protein